MLPLRAVNAREEITLQQKINGQRRISLNLINIAGFAENILRIRKQNKSFILILFLVAVHGWKLEIGKNSTKT